MSAGHGEQPQIGRVTRTGTYLTEDGVDSGTVTWRAAESGVTRCPCCGDDFMTSDIHAIVPCDDCQAAGCEATRDRAGDLGYWDCQVR